MSFPVGAARSTDLATRIRRRLRTVHERTCYRLGRTLPPRAYVAIAEGRVHPLDAGRRAGPEEYRRRFPSVVPLEIEHAARLAAHEFTLLGQTRTHGPRIRWSLDPVSGREWSRGFSPDIQYRGAARLGDIKLPWELNKHQYFFTLGKAAWLTGDPAFADEIVSQIDHWIDDNPYLRGINWISALESSARAIAWMLAYPFYGARVNARFRERLVRSLAQHLVFVERRLSLGRSPNTHLIGEAAALAIGGLFLSGRATRRWLERGLALLEQQLVRQATADGVHVERSVAYHRFCLDHYYLVQACLSANGLSLSPAALASMERMTAFLMHAVYSDGTPADFGDADDARGLWLRADSATDYRGLLALGAVLFRRPDFKWAANDQAEEVFWLFGKDGVAAFDSLAARPAEETSVAYPEAGYYVMRGGWSADDPVMMFDCGPLGWGAAGHGHADALSIQLHAGGSPVLVDAGTFSYNLDYAWRDAFRSTRAHNTIVVDGEDQSIPRDRMSWAHVARSEPRAWFSNRWFDVVDGQHDGYLRLPDPVIHRRAVAFLKPDVWIVCDRLHSSGSHRLESFLHVRPDCSIDPEADRFVLTSAAGRRVTIAIDHGAEAEIIEGTARSRDAWFSPRYGVRQPSRALKATRTFVGDCDLATSLSSTPAIRPDVAIDADMLRCRVVRDEGVTDRFFYRLDAGGRLAGAIAFDGAALFMRETGGEPMIVCARRFLSLSIEGFLDVRASAPIDKLEVAARECEISIGASAAPTLRYTAPAGMRPLIKVTS